MASARFRIDYPEEAIFQTFHAAEAGDGCSFFWERQGTAHPSGGGCRHGYGLGWLNMNIAGKGAEDFDFSRQSKPPHGRYLAEIIIFLIFFFCLFVSTWRENFACRSFPYDPLFLS